jgi:hypothetical protein
LEHIKIYDVGNGRLHEEVAYTLSLLRAQNTFTFGLSRNMFQEDSWIFAIPDPAVVSIDLTTDMKLDVITENYGVQESL